MMGAYEAAEIAFRGTQVIPATEGNPVSETAPDLCATPCPRGHDHTCARPPQHCGFHRDAEQKGDESCSWTDDDRPAVGPVYESPEELAAEIVRLREESARAYSQGVEDMREAAMKAASDAPGTPYTPTEAIRDVTLTSASEDPAPRDGDLTRTLRDAMKRYGVPAVMAEAGRLAQQRL